MPPESPTSEYNDGIEGNPPLTDENVAILYQILSSAEQDPEAESHPFRAIFSAYDTVLPENGLDTDHDQVYLRFLFRLGDRREEGETLLETFEMLLDELGIQIEFNMEEDGKPEVTRNLAELDYEKREIARKTPEPPRRVRRASSRSVYDAEDESSGVVHARADSRASMSRLQTSKKAAPELRPASRATTRPTERASNSNTPRKSTAPGTTGRLTAQEWTQDLHQQSPSKFHATHQSHKVFQSNVANKESSSQRRYAITQAEDSSSSVSGTIESAVLFRDHAAQQNAPFVLGSKERFNTPSRTQLLRDADTFQFYRIRSVARDAVEKWCYAALEAKDQHEHMQRIAAAHDKEILLRQAFEHWRLRLHERKQAAETKQYFERMERTATKARDLYLLTKAFTHWSQCAEDEALRISLARQHILCIKYFHAWKDLTVANQNKVHLQGLRQCFSLWRRRYVQVITHDIKADLANQRRLMKSAYWNWFWCFCEARAPEWQAQRLKKRYLFNWVSTFKANRQRNEQVTLHVETAAKRFFTARWVERTRDLLHDQDVAAAYRRQKLTARALLIWVRMRRHDPLVQQISNMVDWRVAGATFATFVNTYRLEKQAENLNRVRLMRNGWTHWNDHLRWQTLARRIDDRNLLEALYRWAIAERLVLLKRLITQRIKEHYLLKLKDEWNLRQARRNEAYRTIQTQVTRRSMKLILSQWRLHYEAQHHNERIAFEFHAPRLTYESIQSLTRCSRQIQTLNKMASDAAFYFTAKRSIKLWYTASIESKRQKRRNAYIQVRRKTKINIASTMLHRWRSNTVIARELANEADVYDQNRLLRVGANLFERWRALHDVAIDRQFQANDHYEEQLLLQYFHIWNERTHHVKKLERTALLNADLQRQSLALGCLNKLRLRLIELKGPQATAENLRMRYEKRHFLNMLRHWQDKTASRHDNIQRTRTTLSARARRTRLLGDRDHRLGATTRAEEWTELDPGDWIPQIEAQSNATPLSGYLSTPSKRAARARALIQESTTPAGTPFQTRLRAQLNATPRATKRALFGSTTALRSNSFGAVLEGSGSTTVVDRDE